MDVIAPCESLKQEIKENIEPTENYDEYKYLNLISQILEHGKTKSDRTGIKKLLKFSDYLV